MISFIVPAYNEEFELPRTLEAIHDAAGDREYEIIVVDDASTDATPKIAKTFGALVMPINRRQIAAARNAGARISRGEVLFFVDADTRIDSVHVVRALAALEAGCSGGGAWITVEEAIPKWSRIWMQVFCFLYFKFGLAAGAFLFTTRKNFETVGGFDEDYFASEEVWLSIALKKIGRFEILTEPVRTSGRKLRMYSGWYLWSRSAWLLLGGPRRYRSRDALDVWYDGKREAS